MPRLDEGEIHPVGIEIERSRFIAWVNHVPTVAHFDRLLARARASYPDASHHYSAFVAGPPGEQTAIGFSDDGEAADYAGDGVTLSVGWPSDTPLDLTTLEGRLKRRVALLDE